MSRPCFFNTFVYLFVPCDALCDVWKTGCLVFNNFNLCKVLQVIMSIFICTCLERLWPCVVTLCPCSCQLNSVPVADLDHLDQAFRGAVKLGGAKKIFTCLNAEGSLRQSQKWPFAGQESGYFCWSNYAIFQETTIVSMRFIIQKTFEASTKRRASFFTSYT